MISRAIAHRSDRLGTVGAVRGVPDVVDRLLRGLMRWTAPPSDLPRRSRRCRWARRSRPSLANGLGGRGTGHVEPHLTPGKAGRSQIRPSGGTPRGGPGQMWPGPPRDEGVKKRQALLRPRPAIPSTRLTTRTATPIHTRSEPTPEKPMIMRMTPTIRIKKPGRHGSSPLVGRPGRSPFPSTMQGVIADRTLNQ